MWIVADPFLTGQPFGIEQMRVRIHPSRGPVMSPLIITLLCIGGAVLLLIFWLIAVYNGLVVGRNQYKNAYAQIDVQLKRRYDLIPNLVECVKGYMAHERETLEAVIQARNSAFNAGQKAASNPGDPQAMGDLNKAEGQLGGALGRLLALSEAYPDLKANQNMIALQEELTSTENKVGFSRQAYNDAVLAFNNQRGVFPAVMVAGMFGFTEAKMFEIESPAEREAPRVSFK
jgi:LemA protein